MKEYVKGDPIFTSINENKKQYNYLTNDIETDVLIIGGGVSGCINAYYLSTNNINTVLIEKSRIGHLSTSVTTSLLQYELDDTLLELKSVMGLDNSIRAYKLCIDALDEVNKFVNKYGNECDYQKRDTLFYTSDSLGKLEIQNEYELRKENGLDVEYIDENNGLYSFDLKAGVLAKDGGCEIDPYKYSHQLLKVATDNNCRVYENTEAKSIEYHKDYVEVTTIYGYKIKAKKVIVATGYNTSLFTNRNFAKKYNTFNIATKPLKEIIGWDNKVLIRDNKDPYHYLRTTKDNRIIIGGEDVDFNLIENEEIANKKYDLLEQKLKNMFKDIPDLEIEYRYCGCFATTKDNLGFVGKDLEHDNLWYCLGYGANGILFAILGAKMLLKLYNGEVDKDMDLFRVDRF